MCFENLIGIDKQCSTTTPTSGFYLKDSGITTTELNSYVTDDYDDGVALGNDKIDFATELVSSEIHGMFGDKYKVKSFLSGAKVGFIQDNMNVKTGAAELRGMNLKIRPVDSFVSIYIQDLTTFFDYTGNVSVLIYDVKQNKILDTITVASVANEIVTTNVDKTYYGGRSKIDIALLYNASGINSYTTLLEDGGCKSCAENLSKLNPYVVARPIKVASGSDVIQSNIQGMSHTSGLSINYSINCDHRSWLCRWGKQIALPILYKASAEIMNFAMYNSTRINSHVNIEELNQRKEMYELKYRELMDGLANSMSIPQDSQCFICNVSVRSKTILP